MLLAFLLILNFFDFINNPSALLWELGGSTVVISISTITFGRRKNLLPSYFLTLRRSPKGDQIKYVESTYFEE